MRITDTMLLEHVYDGLLQHLVGSTKDFDWMLVKAIIRKESAFNPLAKSHVGACGLMQLMPKTDEWLGHGIAGFDIYKNVQDGVSYLHFLHGFWFTRGIDNIEITNFVLASYNAGQGNIATARTKTKEKGLDHGKWELVKNVLVEVTGSDHSRQTLDYVDSILAFYRQYKGG